MIPADPKKRRFTPEMVASYDDHGWWEFSPEELERIDRRIREHAPATLAALQRAGQRPGWTKPTLERGLEPLA
jgi:hypothetical protein